MKRRFTLIAAAVMLLTMMALPKTGRADVTWERVTSVQTLLDGGTFIIGYEATANSGIIIPMANVGSATTSAAGFMYSGSEATSGGTGTIDMSTVTITSSYEVEIGESSEVSGAIFIKIGTNYLGNTNTKNNCKLFTSQATTTSFTPTIGSNDNFTLDIEANTSGSAYRYLKYNTGSPRFAVYSTTPEKVVIYKKVGGSLQCATPTFSLAQGIYYTNQSVTISTATDGATIYYTTDGTAPTTSSSVYSSAISVNATTTIKAIAVKDGYNNSSVASATYTLKVTAPTFSPVGTTYESALDVTISSSTEGATIYYTEDGSTPTTSSALYSGAISVSETKTIKAIAVKENWSNSEIATATYTITTITPATLPFSWAGGTSAALLATTGVTAYGLGSDYSDATYKIKFDDTDDFIQVKTDSQPAKVTIGVKMLGGSNTSKITVKASTDGISYDEGEELTISGSQNDVVNLETTRSFGSAVRYVRLVFTKGSNVGVGPIGITDNTPSISLNNYSINATSASENGTLIATYTNIDFTNTPEVLFYELDGTTPATYDWLTAVVNDVTHNVDYTINENTVGMRTAYFKVYGLATTSGDDVYSELVTVSQDTKIITGSINFGSASGSTKINETSVTGDDSMGNTWTITSVFSGGSTSFSQNAAYSQVGASSKPATSITFTTTLAESATIADFQAKFGGFSGTAGTVTLKVGETTVGTGSLNASNDVVVGNSSTASGTTLTVTVTDIAKGVKCYYISYTLLTYDIYGSTTITNFTIPVGETLTIHDGGVLTVTGTLTNSGTAANLVIKDGAQLIHTNDVSATMEKNITGYGGAKGGSHWYTIASPVDDEPVSTLTTGTYDLYAYTESTHTWYNQKAHTGDFTTLSRGTGYLYANSAAKVIDFAGSMKATNAEVTVPLSYTDALPILKGINLVGNPFTRNLTAGEVKIDGTALTTYLAVEVGSELVVRNISTTPIKPGQGFFVQLPESHTTTNLVFNPSSKGETDTKPAFVCIEAGDANFMDRAYVQIGQGNKLNKVSINEEVSHLYVTNKGKDFAAVTIENAQGEMPVCFKAAYDGSNTISVSTVGLDLNYLHLIDKLTGNDIDLLATPEYAFSAKSGDSENRFRLVFEANGNALVTSNEPFAYFNGSEWVIENDGNATLQVIDVMGRMLRSENVSGNATTSLPNLSAGVYVLRLVNSESIRTQKVVIE